MSLLYPNHNQYNKPYSISSSIEIDDIINNINFNIKKLKNIFRIYVNKYKYFEDNKFLNKQYINSLEKNYKNNIINKLIEFNNQIKAFISLNSQQLMSHQIANRQYYRPVMLQQPVQPAQSPYTFFNGGNKKNKPKYTKTTLYYNIKNKKYIIYLGSRGAKYIKKDKKYINITTL